MFGKKSYARRDGTYRPYYEKKDSNGRITKQFDEPPYYYDDEYSNFDVPRNWKGDAIVLPQFYTYEYLKKYNYVK